MLLNCLNSEGFVKTTLEQGIRLDGREAFQNRVTDIQFMDQHGNLLYSQGSTQVLIKSTCEIVMPRPERPSEGFVTFRVNCMVCPYPFEQNKKNSNELVKLLEKVIVGSNALDPESLCISTGKYVWQITLDCIVVRDAGNVTDAVLNGSMAALMDLRKPLVNIQSTGLTLGQKQLPLSIAHTPLSFSFGMVQNTLFIDPSLEEELCAETKITVSMNVYGELCSIHKPGGRGISETVLSGIIKVCEKEIRAATTQLRQKVQARKSIRLSF